VRSLDDAALADELRRAGLQVEEADRGLRVAATPEEVGRIAAANQHVLVELREGGADLEDLFFTLTTLPGTEAVAA
jgi:ABC-2 type transport system ATP-binding protein